MISPELLRRYPFFAGFSHEQLAVLAMSADERSVGAEHTFFHEGENLSDFFLLLEGTAVLTIKIPDREAKQTNNSHITGDFITRDINVRTLGASEVFGWSALVPPNEPTASVKALTPCRVVVFNTEKLQQTMDEDCIFGYTLMLKVAQLIRKRLRNRRIESLAEYA
jgi:CRP/FNR family cyclic AMP-dependent transcriptional regulator